MWRAARAHMPCMRARVLAAIISVVIAKIANAFFHTTAKLPRTLQVGFCVLLTGCNFARCIWLAACELLRFCVLLHGCKHRCARLGQRPGIPALLAGPIRPTPRSQFQWAFPPQGVALFARNPRVRRNMMQDKRQDLGDARVKICHN